MAELQELSEQLQKAQSDLSSFIEAREKLESQQQENQTVQKEFSLLRADANIYKLNGPVLLKQDRKEAVMSVDSRLEFIEKEIKRIEKEISDSQDVADQTRSKIMQVQAQMPEQGQD